MWGEPVSEASWPGSKGSDPIRVDAEVIRNAAEGGTCIRLTLEVPGWPGFEPGQFAMLSPGPRGAAARSDPLLPRPMAVFRTRVENGRSVVEILYKVVGRGTALLSEALPGQRIGIVGPLGRAFPAPGPQERVIVVAGGTGIASVFELCARLARSQRVEVLLGARNAADLMAVRDFEALDLPISIATDDGSNGQAGLVTDLLEAALERFGKEDHSAPGPDAAPMRLRVFSCGPTAMMRRCARIATEAGVPCVVALENAMACGFGVCLGCAAPLKRGGYALVCRDGPAFDAGAIDWDRMP
jgi:dihydroorotate dehydrogenase electron transfer subunit